jgi:hypothetical protein
MPPPPQICQSAEGEGVEEPRHQAEDHRQNDKHGVPALEAAGEDAHSHVNVHKELAQGGHGGKDGLRRHLHMLKLMLKLKFWFVSSVCECTLRQRCLCVCARSHEYAHLKEHKFFLIFFYIVSISNWIFCMVPKCSRSCVDRSVSYQRNCPGHLMYRCALPAIAGDAARK